MSRSRSNVEVSSRQKHRSRKPMRCGSVRLGVVLPAAVMAQIRANARNAGNTIRHYVLKALVDHGIVVSSAALQGRPGDDRMRGTGPQLCLHVPAEVMKQLVRLQRHRRCARRLLILEALHAAGIDVSTSDLIPDRRRPPFRAPRKHYACHDDRALVTGRKG